MESLYFFVSNYSSKEDPLNVFDYYFKHGSWGGNAYFEAFIIALIVAILGIIVFYYVIGNKSFRFSTKIGWIVTLVFVGVITFGVTDYNSGMGSSGKVKFGLQKALDVQWGKIGNTTIDKESAMYKNLAKCKNSHLQNFRKGVFSVKPIRKLCFGNSVIAMLMFIFLSLLARKGPTAYCKSIPIK